MVSYEEALESALAAMQGSQEVESVTIDRALGRVLAEDIYARRDLPPFDNSAMDGFAFKWSDLNKIMKVEGTIFAGDKKELPLQEGECFKIMTGAKLPASCDTVAPIEICDYQDETMSVKKDIAKGNAVRERGEELSSGQLILKRGDILNASKIALMASQGITEVRVYKKITIAIASTGNELKEPHEEAGEGEIYNINAINIAMHLKELGFDSVYLGVVPDSLEDAKSFIEKFKEYDVAITTGGISKGEADFTKQAFEHNGLDVIFSGVNVKPGHPTLFGLMDNTFVMAMPGNPLAAILNILLLGVPVLLKMQGAREHSHHTVKVEMAYGLTLNPKRVNIVLGSVKEGRFYPYKKNRYGSGMISPLAESNAIAICKEGLAQIAEGDIIDIIEIG
ncbi:MAG TPA: molybdopterin molybdenumtransferase MoeA [Nitratifractor sp.]|nr:molybdopterin molybdenumtransferase MoeA [Nitratifractor sp.]